MKNMINPHQTIIEIIGGSLDNERTKDVILRRFGLVDGRRQTLEEIGQEYGITRERIRQIEGNGLKSLSAPKAINSLKPSLDFVKEHLAEHGNLKKEEALLEDLACICYPIVKKAKDGPGGKSDSAIREADLPQCQSAFYLILVLGQPFTREKESDKLHALWTIEKKSVAVAKNIIDSLVKLFRKESRVFTLGDLYDQAREESVSLTDKAIFSYLDVSKEIGVNKFGQYGLNHWSEITPRGVRDKAYLILKKNSEPLHFVKITESINQNNLDEKVAQVETVHNELIKDSRFVLVGRGIYALSEWGYEPGTVVDIIVNLLKKQGPLSREEIIKNVLDKRMIKENTVLVNLQNRKHFVKDDGGRYALK